MGKRPQVRNYLVAIEGRLVPIGYNTYSKRVVTALPEAAMEEIDPELISLARFALLKVEDDEVIISKIRGGEAEPIRRCDMNQSVTYYKLELAGTEIHTGYNSETNSLVPYVSKTAAKAQAKHRATSNTAD